MTKKISIILFFIVTLVVLLTWLFVESTKPLPGEKLLQDGRNHLPEDNKIEYMFNPPTSGDHYASWITKGFYEEPRPDGNLVHSQEHGYIIIWYDCDVKSPQGLIGTAYAHEGATPSAQPAPDGNGQLSMTAGSEGKPSAHFEDMPKSFSDGSCNEFKNELKGILNKFGPHKLIVIPRVSMGQRLVLTAWGRMEKLSSIDEDKIKRFIDAYRDKGPEHTIEP